MQTEVTDSHMEVQMNSVHKNLDLSKQFIMKCPDYISLCRKRKSCQSEDLSTVKRHCDIAQQMSMFSQSVEIPSTNESLDVSQEDAAMTSDDDKSQVNQIMPPTVDINKHRSICKPHWDEYTSMPYHSDYY